MALDKMTEKRRKDDREERMQQSQYEGNSKPSSQLEMKGNMGSRMTRQHT